MTWEELKAKAKELGAIIYISPYDDFERITYKGLSCINDGSMLFACETFSENRTPDQMWQIMEALR